MVAELTKLVTRRSSFFQFLCASTSAEYHASIPHSAEHPKHALQKPWSSIGHGDRLNRWTDGAAAGSRLHIIGGATNARGDFLQLITFEQVIGRAVA